MNRNCIQSLLLFLALAVHSPTAGAAHSAEGHLAVNRTSQHCYDVVFDAEILVDLGDTYIQIAQTFDDSTCIYPGRTKSWDFELEVLVIDERGRTKSIRVGTTSDVLDGVLAGRITTSGSIEDLVGDLYEVSSYQDICGRLLEGWGIQGSHRSEIEFPRGNSSPYRLVPTWKEEN